MNLLQKKFNSEVKGQMMKEFGFENEMAVPTIEKVSVNAGLSRGLKGQKGFTDDVRNDLKLITGQFPVAARARKSIAGFKIREGQEVGMKVTLRGERMWDFISRLINVAMPRVRDFQGIDNKNIDQKGNLNLGIKEQLVFPEISVDEVNTIFGFQVSVVTTAEDKEQGQFLLKSLGFPIKIK